MQQLATFTFYGNLNDFLSKKDKHTPIAYSFRGVPSLKDAVEAIGIPHVEVEWLLVNQKPAGFYTPLKPDDRVEVYPQEIAPPLSSVPPVRDNSSRPRRFVLDMHLGALARLLRLMGIDTYYNNVIGDKELAELSAAEQRITLTRDIPLLKQKIITWGYWLRSQDPKEQLLEVIRRYDLAPSFAPFTRCLSCNGNIHPVEKGEVLEHLPPGTRQYFQEFYQCDRCGKVYWKGSHYQHMMKFIETLDRTL